MLFRSPVGPACVVQDPDPKLEPRQRLIVEQIPQSQLWFSGKVGRSADDLESEPLGLPVESPGPDLPLAPADGRDYCHMLGGMD